MGKLLHRASNLKLYDDGVTIIFFLRHDLCQTYRYRYLHYLWLNGNKPPNSVRDVKKTGAMCNQTS